jgi:hypothetical protein
MLSTSFYIFFKTTGIIARDNNYLVAGKKGRAVDAN